MQVYPYPQDIIMKRDMDLVRDLLSRIEDSNEFNGSQFVRPSRPEDFGITKHSLEEVFYNLRMLIKEGFLEGTETHNGPMVSKLTWKGHELLDDIRDPDIWDKTKERIKGLTSVGVGLMWEIAKAEIKKKLGLP